MVPSIDERPIIAQSPGRAFLRRFSIKPGHLDAYLALLPDEVTVRAMPVSRLTGSCLRPMPSPS